MFDAQKIKEIMYEGIPESGKGIGNITLMENTRRRVNAALDHYLTDVEYWNLRDKMIKDGLVQTGRGRGGSVRRRLTKENAEKLSRKYSISTKDGNTYIIKDSNGETVEKHKSPIKAMEEARKLNSK